MYICQARELRRPLLEKLLCLLDFRACLSIFSLSYKYTRRGPLFTFTSSPLASSSLRLSSSASGTPPCLSDLAGHLIQDRDAAQSSPELDQTSPPSPATARYANTSSLDLHYPLRSSSVFINLLPPSLFKCSFQ